VFDIGLHFLSLFAVDIDGHQSEQLDTTFTTVGNPTLSNVVAPDSLHAADPPDTAFITVDAFDPDGLSDIDSVYLTSALEGQPPNPDPTHFHMYDDGDQGGDLIAGDGTYSIIIQADTTSNPGHYTLTFYAWDSDENGSNNPQTIIVIY
jgi:hypothetical protein